MIVVDYIDYGFRWLFVFPDRESFYSWANEQRGADLVVPSSWTLDEWIELRLPLYRKFFGEPPI